MEQKLDWVGPWGVGGFACPCTLMYTTKHVHIIVAETEMLMGELLGLVQINNLG